MWERGTETSVLKDGRIPLILKLIAVHGALRMWVLSEHLCLRKLLTDLPLTVQEQLLIRCVEKIGHNWKAIVNDHFPGRTALQARNQYNQFRRRTGYGSQASTPCSIQSPSQSSTKNRSLSNVAPALHRSRRQQERSLSVDTDLEYEISDDGLSSEDEIDDDDDDRDWSQSQRRMQWDAANDASQMQAIQSLSKDFKTPAMELDPTVESLPYSSMKYPVPDHPGSILEDGQAFEQISDQLLTRSQVRMASH